MTIERVQIIKSILAEKLAPVTLDIIDDSDQHRNHPGAKSGGGHFTVKIVSDAFKNKSLIQRHRMVYEALGDLMNTEIHALSIQAKTSNEV